MVQNLYLCFSFKKAPKLQIWGDGVFIREEEYLINVSVKLQDSII